MPLCVNEQFIEQIFIRNDEFFHVLGVNVAKKPYADVALFVNARGGLSRFEVFFNLVVLFFQIFDFVFYLAFFRGFACGADYDSPALRTEFFGDFLQFFSRFFVRYFA